MTAMVVLDRPALLRNGLHLEYLTVGWNVAEGLIAVGAALASGSVALLGFGIDSFVESASGLALVWRLRGEQRDSDPTAIERLERRASRLVAVTFFGLAAYISWDATVALLNQERPEASPIGIALTTVSIGVMWWLASAKLRTARALGSRALEHDAYQTKACWYLSAVVLVGIGLNALLNWWWADPVAALGVAFLLAMEGREAWSGEDVHREIHSQP